jgi:threonine/homoserine/homoserine lactone efflux protein
MASPFLNPDRQILTPSSPEHHPGSGRRRALENFYSAASRPGRSAGGKEGLVGGTIGDILPLAVGIAISPIPIIAAILMLLSPRARGTSVGFLIGWVAGIVVAVVVFTLLSSVLPGQDTGPAPVAGVIKIVLGALLLLLAVRQWRSRPKAGETANLPKWMSAIDSMTSGKALGLGFLLSAVNPKNLLMSASAGVLIGGAQLSFGQAAVVVIIFTVVAACTVSIPVVTYLLATERMAKPLQSMRDWLGDHNAAIMAVLLLVIGVSMIGKGLGSF